MNRKSLLQLLLLFIIGIFLWDSSIKPEEMYHDSWHFFVIFLMVIFGMVLSPLPMSMMALIGVVVAISSHTVTFQQVFSGFSDRVTLLIVFAFILPRGLIKSGLGMRIAYYFISKLGKNIFGLVYGLITTDLIFATCIPSITARGGGVIYPVARSVAEQYTDGDTEQNKSSTLNFIMKVCYQGNIITGTMFLTAMAGNPLIVNILSSYGFGLTWSEWALGAIVPGLCSLIIMPVVLYFVMKPGIKRSLKAQKMAVEELKKLGKFKKDEILVGLIFVLMIFLWIIGPSIKLDATTTVIIGLLVMILTDVMTWQDALSEKSAWNVLVWFGILLSFSALLVEKDIIVWFKHAVLNYMQELAPIWKIILVFLIYFFTQYFVAGVTTRITLLYGAMLSILTMVTLETKLVVLLLTYFSVLPGGLTHYAVGSAPLYYSSVEMNAITWWRYGLYIAFCNILIWVCIGGLWWKLLGWV